MQKLPIGISSFEVMRTRGFVYVDKTEGIHQLVTEGIYYFLARPRRFGKSLLVSTLRCLFEGKRELFEGLWIAEGGRWEWTPHPVVVIDFNQMSLDTPENLKLSLKRELDTIGRVSQLELEEPLLEGRFKELVLALYQKTQRSVVVLIDEYDKPLIEHLGQGPAGMDVARANRDILRAFFGVLKGADVTDVTRFVLLTGVSRFSRVSVFSALNNLYDITMSTQYAALLGYTQAELADCFQAHIEHMATETGRTPDQVVDALARYYDGYRFSSRNIRVYNPFSTLYALREMALGSYWFETGTPTFLVNLLREQRYALPELEGLQTDPSVFGAFDLERLSPEALLFQTGYLTITQVEEYIYTLGYPNQEVKSSFSKSLLLMTQGVAPTVNSHVLQLAQYLQAGDLEAFFIAMTAIFASIPYDIETKRDEAYFHTLFYLMMSATGGAAHSSVLTSRGRIDVLMSLPEHIYIFEFKCDQSAAAALAQIREQGYAEPYRGQGKPVTLVGVNFSTEQRNVAEWAAEPDAA